jgi:hypothetical protein
MLAPRQKLLPQNGPEHFLVMTKEADFKVDRRSGYEGWQLRYLPALGSLIAYILVAIDFKDDF